MGADSLKELEQAAKALFGKGPKDLLSPNEQRKLREFLWTRSKQKKRDRVRKLKRPEFKSLLRGVFTVLEQGVESPIEEQLALALGSRSMCAGLLETQCRVGPYRIDIAFPHIRLAVECDGKDFHTTPAQIVRDQKRDKYLSDLGWMILRFTGSRIHRDLYGCVDDVTRAYEKLTIKDAWEGSDG